MVSLCFVSFCLYYIFGGLMSYISEAEGVYQSLSLSIGDRSFDHFTCRRSYVTMISSFGYINAPYNLLRYLATNQISISCDGTPVCELRHKLKKKYGNTSSTMYPNSLGRSPDNGVIMNLLALIPGQWSLKKRESSWRNRWRQSWHHDNSRFSMIPNTYDDVVKWKHFSVIGHLCGEFTGPRWIARTKTSDAELWCFLDLRLNKRLSKQTWGWWFETLSRPLWRHGNVQKHIILGYSKTPRQACAIMMVADALAPNKHRAISNYYAVNSTTAFYDN